MRCEEPASARPRPPDVAAQDDTTCEVVVLAGLPTSGNDSWLAAHRPELPVISLDELHADQGVDPDDGQAPVIAAARERARDYLRSATSFAWSATNLSRSLRVQLLELFRSYRARTHVVYCETWPAEQEQRNRSRRDPCPAPPSRGWSHTVPSPIRPRHTRSPTSCCPPATTSRVPWRAAEPRQERRVRACTDTSGYRVPDGAGVVSIAA